MAGLGPEDIDVAQLYDCFSIVPVIELEELGFCEPGEGGAFYAEGHADIGGKLPSTRTAACFRTHMPARRAACSASSRPCASFAADWATRQVEGAEVALVHNEGGVLSSHCTVILANSPR